MRIITGIARGMNLETLEGEEITRPTSSRVKEDNMLKTRAIPLLSAIIISVFFAVNV